MTTHTQLLIIGGSDAGISAALRAKELAPDHKVTLLLADSYPNLSICGFPYAFSGEVESWENLRHRTLADLQATGIDFHLDTRATAIKADQHLVTTDKGDFTYDKLIVGTGALPATSSIKGAQNAFVLHDMADYFAIDTAIIERHPKTAAIIGAGYIGVEMTEGLIKRGVQTTLYQRGTEILPTLEPEMSAILNDTLTKNGVNVVTNYPVTEILADGTVIGTKQQTFDLVLVVTGVRPNSDLLMTAGAHVAKNGAVIVDDFMQTNLPDVYAAGDLTITKHRLLGDTYLPLGTTAHKQGRTAGAHAVGFITPFRGIVGSQVLKAFDKVVVRTGLLPNEAKQAGFAPFSVTTIVDDHKAYIPGATKIHVRITGDAITGQLLGAQLIGQFGSEVAKRADIFASAIFHHMTVSEFSDLDLSYSPPIAAPWDAVQQATQAWESAWRTHQNRA
ncbi:MAG TPA: FAD-dependent oxidoreductase [Lactobacillaceae bacterium]|jgi:NADPH-dependent 2,4-dienoyl-CoA reductase/sulfur reductase-like enzyme